VGVDINKALSVNGQPIVNPPPALEETLVGNVVDMWKAGVYPLSIFILFFSGMWPYIKLILMLCCWFMPAHRLSVKRRQHLLEFLDAFGKWSLVDTYVLVLFLVAFDIQLKCQCAAPFIENMCKASDNDGEFRMYVLPTMGFHYFLIATLMSLFAGLWMFAAHRYAHQVGEFGPIQNYDYIEGMGNRRALCMLLRPDGGTAQVLHRTIPLWCAAALGLSIVGIFVNTFRFKFLGVAEFVLGPEASVRAFSLWTLGLSLPEHSINPSSFGIHWIEVFFLIFSGATILMQLVTLLVLWVKALTVGQQRKLLVFAQFVNSITGMDVFIVSICASVLQIEPYAQFIATNTGIAQFNPYLEEILPKIPFIASKIDTYDIFDLNSRFAPGFSILALACAISTTVGLIVLRKSSSALFDTMHRPLAESFAEAAGSTVEARRESGLF
jgi:hypothetical protein